MIGHCITAITKPGAVCTAGRSPAFISEKHSSISLIQVIHAISGLYLCLPLVSPCVISARALLPAPSCDMQSGGDTQCQRRFLYPKPVLKGEHQTH